MRPWKNHASKGEWGWFLSFLPRRVATVLGMCAVAAAAAAVVCCRRGPWLPSKVTRSLSSLVAPRLRLPARIVGARREGEGPLEASEVQHLTGRERE